MIQDYGFWLMLAVLVAMSYRLRTLTVLAHRLEWCETWIRALAIDEGGRRTISFSDLVGPVADELPTPCVVIVVDTECSSCRVALNALIRRMPELELPLVITGFGLAKWQQHVADLQARLDVPIEQVELDARKRETLPGLPLVAVSSGENELVAATSIAGTAAVDSWVATLGAVLSNSAEKLTG